MGPGLPATSELKAAAANFLKLAGSHELCSGSIGSPSSPQTASHTEGQGVVAPSAHDYELLQRPLLSTAKALDQVLLKTGGSLYLQPPLMSLIAPGKQWINLEGTPASELVGIPATSLVLNPVTLSQLLDEGTYQATAGPATKTALGEATPFDVTMSASEVKSALQRAGASAEEQSLAVALAGGTLHASFQVGTGDKLDYSQYISTISANGTPRKIEYGCLTQNPGPAVTISGTPPASKTISFSQYVAAATAYQKKISGKGAG